MNNILNLFLIITFVFFPSLLFAGEEKRKIKPDVSKEIQIVKRNLKLLWIGPCSDAKKSDLCLGIKLPAGRIITVLHERTSQLCKVKTTGKHMMIPGEDQEEEGFKLENIDCPDDLRYGEGFIGKVTDYEKLKYDKISDGHIANDIDKKIRAFKIFKPIYYKRAEVYERNQGSMKLFEGLPEVYKYPYPNAQIYFARYGHISPLVLFINGKSKILIENYHLCCEDTDAFRLNGRYYFRASECPEQELPICNTTIYEIVNENKEP